MTIDELYKNGEISVRSYNVCRFNQLYYVSDLINYYYNNKTFLTLRNCGSKSNVELIQLCDKYKDDLNKIPALVSESLLSKLSNNQIETINNFIIRKTELLSVRLKNAIRHHMRGEPNVAKFAENILFRENFNVKNLRNIGSKSTTELTSYISDVENFILLETNTEDLKHFIPKGHLEGVILNLTRFQREVVNSFILIKSNSLSARSKNGISLYLESNFNIKHFAQKGMFLVNFNFKNLRNIGAKCVPELKDYIIEIKRFLIQVSESNDEKHLISLKNKFIIQQKFSISKIPNQVLETQSIFLLTDFLLNSNALFKKKETSIVKKAFKIYQNQSPKKYDDIAIEVNLTRERVRQIVKSISQSFRDNLLFIQNFDDDLFQKYNIDIHTYHIEIDTEIVDRINNINSTNFSREFITYILFVFFGNQFSLIGEFEDILQPKSFKDRNRHNWSNFYLIQSDIVSEIDFISFANDINNRLNDRIEESYSFNFKSYLSRFLTNENIEILDLAFPIGEKIVNDEFNIYLNLSEEIEFKRTTLKLAHEYVYEALDDIGIPSNVRDITIRIHELFPEYITNEDSVRSSMTRSKGFVPIGRKSVYGLKKWESEREDFKGGTIKDVIIEFLQDKNEPPHILSVLEYLDKFRKNKNATSVLTNLKLDPLKRFLVYNQGFIGLQSKQGQYDDKFKSLPKQLGKTIIGKHKKGYSIKDIQDFLLASYNLTFNESKFILNNLNYFNENKRN